MAVERRPEDGGSLLRVIERLAQLPSDATGAVRFGAAGHDVGVVLFEAGRICWATAARHTRRLTDMIADRHRIGRAPLEAIYAECRSKNLPIGEYLVDRGLVDAAALEKLLLEHSAEALLRIAELEPSTSLWVAHKGGSYLPRFTFPTPRVLAHAGAMRRGRDPEALGARLDRLSGDGGMLVCFDCTGRAAVPMAIANAEHLSSSTLVELGQLIVQHARIAQNATLAPRLVALHSPIFSVLAIFEGDVAVAGLCEDSTTWARMMARFTRGEHADLRS